MEYKVLITTSGVGSRLGELTDYTNKCLVRIVNKPAISHIIENYPKETKFVITLGYYGDLVKQFLEIAYPEHNFEFVWVDKFKGVGSSLGYSILQAKKNLQCPFIFNACDTLMATSETIKKSFSMEDNFCVGATRNDSSQYATILVAGDSIKEIKRKGEIKYDYAYVGLCGIVDYDLFFDLLEKQYTHDPMDSSLHEGHVINKMLENTNFKFLSTDEWYDIGNVGELEKTKTNFKAEASVLEKKEESIYFFEDSVIKFFKNKTIAENRVKRASHLAGLTPQILDSSSNFYKYKKEPGELLSEVVTEDLFSDFLDWAQKNLWKIQEKSDNFNSLCHDFYISKTLKRVDAYLKNNSDPREINQVSVKPIKQILSAIDQKWLTDGICSTFHGDFILDNVLKTKSGYCLLDWRQDFAGSLSGGDIYYDLAKLNHNLVVNHQIVNNGLFNASEKKCFILCNSTLLECQKTLHTFLLRNRYDLKKVKLLTALIWINMAPLHEYPFNQFLFNYGKLNLAKMVV